MRYIEAHKRFKEGQQITHQIFLIFFKFDMFSNNNLVMKKTPHIYTLQLWNLAILLHVYPYTELFSLKSLKMAMIIQFP